MILVESLDEEEQRAVKEGLDEETLTLFDLLLKPDLSKQEIIRIKKVTQGLYKTLQSEISKIQDFHAKQSTRDNIKVAIKDFLWSYKTGLPESFAPEEIEEKTEIVFSHVLMGARNSNSDWRVEPTQL
jgi:type I restriction enzyme, R subunit